MLFPMLTTRYATKAVKNCVKENGLSIFLTATSTDELDKKGSLRRVEKVKFTKAVS